MSAVNEGAATRLDDLAYMRERIRRRDRVVAAAKAWRPNPDSPGHRRELARAVDELLRLDGERAS